MIESRVENILRTAIIWPPSERNEIGQTELEVLADTIRVHGILEPIGVARDGQGFAGLWGRRRWMAAEIAGLELIPAIVREMPATATDAMEIRLIENVAREDLSPLDQATALDQLIKASGFTASQAAQRIGMRPSNVSKLLALLQLPQSIRDQIEAGTISAASGYELTKAPDAATQAQLAMDVACGKLTRDTLGGIVKAARKGSNEATHALRVTIRLSDNRSVSIRGGEVGVDGAIKTLEDLLSRLRPARAKGLSLATVVRMLSDESK